jgi:putative MATE family efflux protein
VSVFIFSKSLLRLLRTPEDIINSSSTYLRIIFGGLFFTFLYNIYACALRSVGDSKTPIRFLAIASVLNGVLDYIFIAHFHLGVAGAALATVIAEAVSGILCLIHVYRNIPLLRLEKKDFVVDRTLLSKTIHYSWATALQQASLYIGKTIVQITVNPLGVDSIATFNAVNRVDDFAFTPQQSIAQGMTVYVAQNRGAQKNDRVKEGLRKGLILETLYGVFICLVIFFAATPIMSVFVKQNDIEVITLGSTYLKTIAFFYILPAFTNGIQGYFRGLGKMKITLNATFTQMLFRVLFSFLLAREFGIQGIAFACFGGWIAMLLYEVPVLIKNLKMRDETVQH